MTGDIMSAIVRNDDDNHRDPEPIDRLRAIAKEEGVSLGDVIREGMEWRAKLRNGVPSFVGKGWTPAGHTTRPATSTSSSPSISLQSTLVTDTSVLFAALDRTERDHRRCTALVASGRTVVLPAPVLTETTMLSRSRGTIGATDGLLASVLDGTVVVVDLQDGEYGAFGVARTICRSRAQLRRCLRRRRRRAARGDDDRNSRPPPLLRREAAALRSLHPRSLD